MWRRRDRWPRSRRNPRVRSVRMICAPPLDTQSTGPTGPDTDPPDGVRTVSAVMSGVEPRPACGNPPIATSALRGSTPDTIPADSGCKSGACTVLARPTLTGAFGDVTLSEQPRTAVSNTETRGFADPPAAPRGRGHSHSARLRRTDEPCTDPVHDALCRIAPGHVTFSERSRTPGPRPTDPGRIPNASTPAGDRVSPGPRARPPAAVRDGSPAGTPTRRPRPGARPQCAHPG